MSFNMNTYSAGGGADLGQAKGGPHLATLIGLVDVGVQDGGTYQNQPKPPCQQLLFVFELSDDQVELDGVLKNRTFTTKINAKSGEKAKLTKIVTNLDPANATGGDLTKLLGTACILNLKEDPRADGTGTITKFESISPLLQGMVPPPVETPLFAFTVDAPDMNVFANSLHSWMKEIIKSNHSYSGSELEKQVIQYEAAQQQQSLQQAQAPAVPANSVPAPVPSAVAPNPAAPVPSIPGAPPVLTQPAAPAPVPQPANIPAAPPGFVYNPQTGGFDKVQ